ncbi:MAG: DUF3999 domain-containing protein [Synergistaceae bacterium]|nr:DUF3999 domain-containing protein [Synergistaceae bacterium]
MRKIIMTFAAIAALCAATAMGAQRQDPEDTLSIEDFAFRYSLGGISEGRVYRLHVTNDIFGRLGRSYGTDLAVFDSDANPVPFILRDAKMPYAPNVPARSDPVRAEVPLFPLPAAASPSASMMDVTIRTGEDGQVIEIVGGGSKTQSGGTNRFLADLSKLGAPMDGRRIMGYDVEIPSGGEEDAEAYVDVYASDNLRGWRQIAWKEPLIRLRRGDDVVASGVIELGSSGPVRYLMLEADGAWEFPGSVVVSARISEREAEIRWDSELFRGLPDDESRSVIYDTAGAFPASEVNFILENPGVYMASVSSRNSAEDEWRRHGDIRLSFMKSGAGYNRNSPIHVFSANDRFWRLAARDGLPSPPPAMRMYWHPKELVFVAQGKPPYIFAFGGVKDSPGLAKPDLMRAALDDIDERDILEAEIGASVPPASFDRPPLLDSGGTAAGGQWTKYVVWAVLVGGALLLSWISWNLIQKSKTGE